MSESRIQNSVRNSLFGLISKLIMLLFPFIIRTIIIRTIGAEYLGLNSLFSTILQVLSLTELGVGNAIVHAMYRPIAKHNDGDVCALLKLFKKVYSIIGICIITFGLLSAPFLKYLINGEVPNDINLYLLYFIFILNTASSYVMFAYKQSLLTANQRSDIIYKINAITNTIMYISQIVILLCFKDYYLYALLLPLGTIIYNLLIGIVVNRRYPMYKPSGKLDSKYTVEIKRNVFALCGHKIGSVLLNSCDTLFVSAYLGLISVSMYNNYHYIISSVEGILSIFFASILAGVGNSIVVDNKQRQYETYKNLSFMNSWVTTWCSICLLFLFQPFMELWMGKQYLFGFSTVIFWTIFFYIHNIRNIVNTYKDAAGLWMSDFYKPYIGIVLDIILNIVLYRYFGVNGIIIATISTFFFVYLPCEIKVLYISVFPGHIKEFLITSAKEIVLTVFISGIVGALVVFVKVDNMVLNLIYRILICCIVPNLIWIICFHKKDEMKYCCHFVRKLVDILH